MLKVCPKSDTCVLKGYLLLAKFLPSVANRLQQPAGTEVNQWAPETS